MAIRFWVAVIVVSVGMFSYGQCYVHGLIGKRFAIVVGATIGFVTALVPTAPDFRPLAASIATIVIITLVSTVMFPLAAGVMDTTRAEMTQRKTGNQPERRSKKPK